MSFTLAGNDLPMPAPDGIHIEDVPQGVAWRTWDAALHVDQIATKARITIHWPMLSMAERATLSAAYAAHIASSGELVLPDGQTFTVLAAMNGWTSNIWFDFNNEPHYTVDITFEEA